MPVLLLALCLLLSGCGSVIGTEPDLTPARTAEESLCYLAAPGSGAAGRVLPQEREDGTWLFLPASAAPEALRLRFPEERAALSAGGRSLSAVSDRPFDLTALFPETPEDGIYVVELDCGGEQTVLHLMFSAAIASVFLASPDAAHGRAWVEGNKSHKAKHGSLLMLRPDGSVLYDGELDSLRGRGNSTWALPKKPYQLKLAKAVNLLENGNPAEDSKTWLLLADFADPSHLRNRITLDLAAALGLEDSPGCRSVDLWYDGEYRGCYLLCEKVEAATGRVEIGDPEAAVARANREPVDGQPTVLSREAGKLWQYVSGLNAPEEETGWLLEMDYPVRAREETSWFVSDRGFCLVVKCPEACPEALLRSIRAQWQRFEDAIFDVDGASLAALAELDSLARCYLIQEFSHNTDAYLSSSYFYCAPGSEKIRCGPVWDFDIAYRYQPEGFFAGVNPFGRALLEVPALRAGVMSELEPLGLLVRETLLAEDPEARSGRLRSLTAYEEELAASYAMDLVLWPETLGGANWDEATEKTGLSDHAEALRLYLAARMDFLEEATADWNGPAPALTDFTDLWPGSPGWAEAEFLVSRGILDGDSEKSFGPWKELRRADAALALWRLAGEPEAPEAEFPDVDADAPYAAAAAWALSVKGVEPDESGEFRPDGPITREEFFVMLYRCAGAPAPRYNYPQYWQRVSFAHRPAVSWVLDFDLWLDAVPNDGSPLHLEIPISRREAAIVLGRYCRKMLKLELE